MNAYDERLRKMQQSMTRKEHLKSIMNSLTIQRCDLEEQVSELEQIKIKEQSDVDKLEGGSLFSFFYHVIGKKDERLTKEREEAYAAAVKYDAAMRQLESVEYDLKKAENELLSLADCEVEYERTLEEKKKMLIESDFAYADRILELDHKLASMKSHNKEVDEAMAAGQAAMKQAKEVLHELDSADGWSTFDLLGGGIIADAIKYSHMDNAQSKIEDLQVALRRFQTELADVSIQANLSISVDGFLRFADYFFDNIFTDWAVKDKISSARNQLLTVEMQIQSTMDQLEEIRHSDDAVYTVIKELDELVLKS